MIPILYENNEMSFVSGGLCRLSSCLSAVVTEERNGIYELEFSYPVSGDNYDMIQPGRIVAVTHDISGDVQPFDIVGFSKPIDGVVTFRAVHVSYRLAETVVSLANVDSLTTAINRLNSISELQFAFDSDFTSSGWLPAANGVPRSVRQLLGGVEGSILDTYGGEYVFDIWSVRLKKERGISQDFSVRYGVDLLDYNDDSDYSETYTRAVPFWSNGEETVVGAVVDSGFTSYNGRQATAALDLSEKFESKPTAAQLERMALSLMKSRQTNLPQQTISVDFLHDAEGFSSLKRCNLCDMIGVIFPRYGMEGRFKIVKTVYDALADRYQSMELGKLSTTLGEALGITGGGLSSNGPAPVKDVMVNGVSVVDSDGIAMVTNTAGDLSLDGDLSADTITSGGKITAGGRFVLPYNTYFAAKDANNNEQGMLFFYNNGEIFGNNSFPTTIRGSSISLSNPLSAFYKVTTVTVSVAALSAHANVAASSHTMTAQSGFNAVGIVGWSSGSYRIRPTTHYIASNTSLYAGFANTSASATSQAYDVVFYVLWLKATSA